MTLLFAHINLYKIIIKIVLTIYSHNYLIKEKTL